MSSISTPYIAQVQRVFSDRGGRVVKVTCPFLCGSAHEHPWPNATNTRRVRCWLRALGQGSC